MLKQYRDKMFCFSPLVMLSTFLIEFAMAFYTLWRYKMTTVTRLIFITLLSLGTFQLAEYMLCGELGLTNVDWARVGYGAITLLPALGIHLTVVLAKKKLTLLVGAAYATCAAFLAFFLFGAGAVSAVACYANYAVFDTSSGSAWLYTLYYYGWLLTTMFLAAKWSKAMPKKTRRALLGMVLGYTAFILPTTFFNIIDPSTVQGIPSIMCGFAVIFAIVLVAIVLPNGAKTKK